MVELAIGREVYSEELPLFSRSSGSIIINLMRV